MCSPRDNRLRDFCNPGTSSPPLPFDSITPRFYLHLPPVLHLAVFHDEHHERADRTTGRGPPVAPGKDLIHHYRKMLPDFLGMLGICAVITLYINASPLVLLPLVPIIVFFLQTRSSSGCSPACFKELSFISIFFSTVATSVPVLPKHFCKRPRDQSRFPTYPYRAYHPGNRMDRFGLSLCHRAFLADCCRPLLYRGTELQ